MPNPQLKDESSPALTRAGREAIERRTSGDHREGRARHEASDRRPRYFRDHMGTIYAIANQKGGVGKTTTAVNIAACVADGGYETLLVDLDAQCNATVALNVEKGSNPNVYDVLSGELALDAAAIPTDIPGLSLVPSTPELAGANIELPRPPGSE